MIDKKFEKELDKMYDAIDQKQYKMEELGLINYGDSGYYWRNPEEYEKDNRIVELESKIEKLEIRASKNFDAYMKCSKKYTNLIDENLKLKNELMIAEKALELACKELRDLSCMECNSCNRFEMCDYVLSTYPASYFIEEAKEKMKSE